MPLKSFSWAAFFLLGASGGTREPTRSSSIIKILPAAPSGRKIHAFSPSKTIHDSRGFITGLLERADIVDVINRYVPLKKAGRNWMCCCPFHKEKTPSFSVSQTKQFFKCFAAVRRATPSASS